MSDNQEFFRLRREGKTYISKVFTFPNNTEPMRNVVMVLEGSDVLHIGEIEGALRLRISGVKRKTQVTALVSQDDKAIRRVTLQTFQSRSDGDWLQGYEQHCFTLRQDEYHRLMNFLDEVDFIDLENPDGFHIEDMSGGARRRAIVDAADRSLIEQVRSMNAADKAALLSALGKTLTPEEINILLGRRTALEEFEREMQSGQWSERQWQEFFERQPWVFGYGLHYRVMRPFDREMTVSAGEPITANEASSTSLCSSPIIPHWLRLSGPTLPFSRPSGEETAVRAHMRSATSLLVRCPRYLNRKPSG